MNRPWNHSHEQDTALVLAADEIVPARNGSAWQVLSRLMRNPRAVTGFIILATVGLLAVAAPLVYPGDPLGIASVPLLMPGENPAYPLGTDSIGRDVAAELLHGARVSVTIGLAAAAIGVVLGLLVGAPAGYLGGWADRVLGWISTLFQTFPHFLLLIVIFAIVPPSVPAIACGIGVTSWPVIARLTRAEFRSLRGKDFVIAARSLGYSPLRIMVREILPNALPPVIVTSSFMVASAILAESGLAFLGLSDPNQASWGCMIADGRDMIRTAWSLTAIPGAAIALTVLGLNLAGEGLNEALNPKAARHG